MSGRKDRKFVFMHRLDVGGRTVARIKPSEGIREGLEQLFTAQRMKWNNDRKHQALDDSGLQYPVSICSRTGHGNFL